MTCKKTLIKVALPLDAINKASAREKSNYHSYIEETAARQIARFGEKFGENTGNDPSKSSDRRP